MPWILPSARKRPDNLGLKEGRLPHCPSSPNCVCSQAVVTAQQVDPFPYTSDRAEAKRLLLKLIKDDPKATLITEKDNYLHAEYRAFIFLDDVEFFFPDDESIIHVRSASRIGHSDLGANKRRIEAISAAFSLLK